MKTSRFFFWIIISLFLYQNCGEEKKISISVGRDGTISSASIMGKIDTGRPISYDIENSPVEMDLQTGELISANSNLDQLCLSTNKLNELNSLLENNEACHSQHKYPEDIVCAFVYTPAYIQIFLLANNSPTAVGETPSSCPKESIAFCKDDEAIKGFIQSLTNTDFAACP